FYNNIFVGGTTSPKPASASDTRFRTADGFGLWVYDTREFPLQTAGNVYLNGARPFGKEATPLTIADADPRPRIIEEGGAAYVLLDFAPAIQKAATVRVNTDLLGKARIPGLGYENPDGSPLVIDTDYFGKKRSAPAPTAGPFEKPGEGNLKLKLW